MAPSGTRGPHIEAEAERGHALPRRRKPDRRAQTILIDAGGVLQAGSEPRTEAGATRC